MNIKRDQEMHLQGQLRALTNIKEGLCVEIELIEDEIQKLNAPELTDEQKAYQATICEECG